MPQKYYFMLNTYRITPYLEQAHLGFYRKTISIFSASVALLILSTFYG